MPKSFAQVTPELWVTQSPIFSTNSGIFIKDGRALLVDPAILPDEIKKIARFIEERATPQAIIVTHSHWDHVFGPEYFPSVPVLTHARYTQSLTEGAHAEITRRIAEFETEQKIVRTQPFVVPVPNHTFNAPTEYSLNGLVLRLAHMPGHTPDELVIYHAETGLLWAGDMLSDLEIPFVQTLADYQQTLDQLATWDVRILIPNHGSITTNPAEIAARISDDQRYLAELRQRVETAIREGRTREETIALCNDMQFRAPKENAGPHRRNIEGAYMEFQR